MKKKRGPGRPPTGLRPSIGVRLYQEMEERIDQWIAQRDDPDLGRHEAIRRLLDYALTVLLKSKPLPQAEAMPRFLSVIEPAKPKKPRPAGQRRPRK
jgi:hypothetical protein